MTSAADSNPWTLKTSCLVRVVVATLVMMRQLRGTVAENIFFNSYGNCKQQYFSLADEVYRLQATGAANLHETLICEMTFKAPPGSGVCLTFSSFEIDDCRVSLAIYQEPTAAGKQWKKLTCDSPTPAQMCSPERHVTLKLAKTKLNQNRGYRFSIQVEKSTNMTGEDVILASSIGLFVGIIAGVVALIVILAVLILCCCCKPCKSQQLQHHHSCKAGSCSAASTCGGQEGAQLQQVMPSAPPIVELEDESTPLQGGPGMPLYPALHPPQPYQPYHPAGYGIPAEQPPPYAPPPYEQHDFPTKV